MAAVENLSILDDTAEPNTLAASWHPRDQPRYPVGLIRDLAQLNDHFLELKLLKRGQIRIKNPLYDPPFDVVTVTLVTQDLVLSEKERPIIMENT